MVAAALDRLEGQPIGRVGDDVRGDSIECVLADIPSNAVPIAIAADIVGEEVWCNECTRTWTIVSIDPPPVVVMRLA